VTQGEGPLATGIFNPVSAGPMPFGRDGVGDGHKKQRKPA
jgi:hypothetical protein